MRLDKFVCKSTSLTRTQARAVIAAGSVKVNAEVVQDDAKQVHENNHIVFNGHTLVARPFRYLIFHKAQATLCSNLDGDHPSIFNDINIDKPLELHIVGRLDVDTTGLVFITDDGRWSFDIIRPQKSAIKCIEYSYAIRLTSK